MADFPDSTPMTEISRPVIEAEIELLIDLLDQLDEDPDAEPDDDGEPWLGAAEGWRFTNWGSYETSRNDDRESDDCDLENGHDEEPELGWTAVQASTGKFYSGVNWIAEDSEDSLASTNSFNQVHWSKGKGEDVEEQCDDEGAIDCDREHTHDGRANYMGECSPVSTMLGLPPFGHIS